MSDFTSYGIPSDEWRVLEATLPPFPNNLSVSELKAASNQNREATARREVEPLLPKLKLQDYSIPTRDNSSIEARTYRPSEIDPLTLLPVYVHFHGGGFLFGTLSSEDAICARIALSAGVIVLNVNYRHTPEFPYPVAWNDAEDAYEWLQAHVAEIGGIPDKVVVGGISAGGQLSASLTLQRHLGKVATKYPAPAGQVLMIPCLAHEGGYGPRLKENRESATSSFEQCKNAPILPVERMALFGGLLKIQGADETDLRLNPGNATLEQVRGLPPTTFGIAGLDPLRDQGLLYAQLLAEAKVPTEVNVFKGVPHGFRRFSDLSVAKIWDEVMVNGIKWALTKPVGSGEFEIKEY